MVPYSVFWPQMGLAVHKPPSLPSISAFVICPRMARDKGLLNVSSSQSLSYIVLLNLNLELSCGLDIVHHGCSEAIFSSPVEHCCFHSSTPSISPSRHIRSRRLFSHLTIFPLSLLRQLEYQPKGHANSPKVP